MTENTNPEAETERAGRRFRRALPGRLVALAALLIGFVGVTYALLAFAFWAADGSWDFEGDKSFRYWFFVSGKRAETLGVVAPTDKPVQ
ncbi:MAG: hypothetical protein K8F62_09295 [Pseudorhodoplanes sp.]|nr:hypothetical protein [Pseudorhodoplanes sp.]